MRQDEEPYEAFLAREEADDWRDRAVQEGRMIGDLNGEINNLNERHAALVERLGALVKHWRKLAESMGDSSPWTATVYGHVAFVLEQEIAPPPGISSDEV